MLWQDGVCGIYSKQTTAPIFILIGEHLTPSPPEVSIATHRMGRTGKNTLYFDLGVQVGSPGANLAVTPDTQPNLTTFVAVFYQMKPDTVWLHISRFWSGVTFCCL